MKLVVIGAGFGGLYAARSLADAQLEITILDRRNHHLFQPLLYQVATGALNPADIAEPVRKIFRRQKNATVILGEAQSVDLDGKKVHFDGGELAYEYLIVATGSTHSYFGHEEWSRHAPPLKTVEDALEIRRRVLLAFEAAERDPEDKRSWLTFVIVGGGPTGVELSGALVEVARNALRGDFRNIDPSEARVILIEGEDRILPPFSPRSVELASERLRRMGIEVRTGAEVTGVDESGVFLGEERIEAKTVLWAAGVAPSSLPASLGVELAKGRVIVTPELSVPGHPEAFVIGDACHLDQDGHPVPGVAQAAIQEGLHAAANIRLALAGQPPLRFRYRDKGMLAAISRGFAVADLPAIRLSGPAGWVVWLVVHIYFLIGFQNRMAVMAQWIWTGLTSQRGARLITGAWDARIGQDRRKQAGPDSNLQDGHTAKGPGGEGQ